MKAALKRPTTFTLKRRDLQKEELKMRALEVGQWLGSLLADVKLSATKSTDELFAELKDGLVLCRAVEKAFPAAKLKYKNDNKPFAVRENVSNLLATLKGLKLCNVTLFEVDDLIERKNEKAVLTTILQLAEHAAQAGYKPPMLIQYQLEVEKLEQQHKAAKATLVEVHKKESTEPTTVKPVAEVSPQLKTESSTSASVEKKVDKPADDMELGEAFVSLLDEAENSYSAAGGVAVKKRRLSTNMKKTIFALQYLPYYPREGDSIDAEVSRLVNRHLLDLDISPIEIHIDDDVLPCRGEYKIAGEWAHVRQLGSTLWVYKYPDQWIDFVSFCESKMGFKED